MTRTLIIQAVYTAILAGITRPTFAVCKVMIDSGTA